jgi:branched-chain amino acid transport system substrate-binding protein
MPDKPPQLYLLEDPITRRSLIKKVGAAGGLVAGGSLLAACGSSSKKSSAGGGTLSNSAEAKELRDLMGISTADAQKLAGKTLNYGAILPLSGPGAQYAIEEQNGVKLAIDQMQKHFGLKIKYDPKDHKSGDPGAGAAAARELGVAGIGAAINSYVGVFGATIPAVAKYKMLSLDPGGGTYPPFEGKPYFWGWRAQTPLDAFDGAYLYAKAKLPQAKRVALVVWDLGDILLNPIKASLKKALAAGGQQLVGVKLQKVGQTDYSSIISSLKGLNPDIVHLGSYALDPANFMKQYLSSGLKAQVIGSEYTPAAAKLAGAAYDKYWAATDFFNFDDPPNPWSDYFVRTYKAKFGADPNTFYETNYYECTLAYLELARRVAVKGGDINKGDQLQDALVANPRFKSVYGGDKSTVGEIVLDTKRHTPSSRAVGLFKFTNNGTKAVQLAAFDIGGKDFKVLA